MEKTCQYLNQVGVLKLAFHSKRSVKAWQQKN